MNGLLPTPDLAQILDMKMREAFSLLNCHQIGRIESFEATTQTAEISLTAVLQFAGTDRPYPVLSKVPVFVHGGGDRSVTIPIRPGDTCLVLYNDHDIDTWTQTGASAPPASNRQHSVADAMAIVGFRSLANPVSQYSTTDVEIRNGLNKIAVGDLLLLKNSVTDLLTVMQVGVAAMLALNGKTGPDASTAITAFQNQLRLLLKSS